ncbi:MAG: hypothetical protein GTO12_06045, partial [Proteobacteria bacterium]|nr:hypothetical protein [Pseudomonadota bacterium]
MQKRQRLRDMALISLGEISASSVFFLFLWMENVVGIILVILGIGGCWYLFDRFQKVQIYLTATFRREKGFSIFLAVLLLILLPVFLREDPYLIHICLTAGIYVMLATGLNYQLGSTN